MSECEHVSVCVYMCVYVCNTYTRTVPVSMFLEMSAEVLK